MSGTRPGWFHEAVRAPAYEATVTVEGARVRLRRWGPRSAPPVVLVHGGAAHARWWDHLGPLLAADGPPGPHQVVALDLTGHGDADHRPSYRLDTWAREVVAAAAHAGGDHPPVLVGHSMGGLVAVAAAARADVAGLAIIDAPIRPPRSRASDAPQDERGSAAQQRQPRRPSLHPDRDTARAHFRLIPPQPPPPPFVLEHVAEHSLRPTTQGWTWKFDPELLATSEDPADQDVGALLAATSCPAALIHGAHSTIVDEEVLAHAGAARPDLARVSIPAAHHHVPLDQPLALLAALRTLLATWTATTPGAPTAPTGRRAGPAAGA